MSSSSTPPRQGHSTAWTRAGKNALAGGVASASAKTLVAPFERSKILLQTQNLVVDSSNRYTGVLDVLRRVPREQGFLALWRGNFTNCCRIVPTYALRFTLFDSYKDLVARNFKVDPQKVPLHLQVLPACMSGATTVLVTYPLDLLRTRMSADPGKKGDLVYKNLFAAFRQVIETGGVRSLYKGIVVAALEITPYVGISLGGYSYLKANFSQVWDSKGGVPWWAHLPMGWLSGIMGSLTCYPLDSVKRQLMLDGSQLAAQSKYKGKIVNVIKGVYREQGIRGFYRGCLINVINSGPAIAITFTLHDIFIKGMDSLGTIC